MHKHKDERTKKPANPYNSILQQKPCSFHPRLQQKNTDKRKTDEKAYDCPYQRVYASSIDCIDNAQQETQYNTGVYGLYQNWLPTQTHK
ncbi:hypothetical protein [Eisenibacter elegans]|uniref:hypothetical protein n=1 Tax=Eisenibacter elegans TaxID=997 RepID=UPI0012B65A56|nr:hypothetical protein [Eisenibacter elegans]